MEARLLQGLNIAQKAAVTSEASVLQVLAPPGSGKTTTLTSRVGYLITHHGYNPQNVICCTFTVKASREMRERLCNLIGADLESKLVMGTFHSICRRLLAVYGHLIGVPKGFGIADSSDSASIIKRIIKRLNLSLDPKKARSKISSQKSKGKTPGDLRKSSQKQAEEQEFMTIFQEYESDLAASQLLDYDDLLLRCVDLLRAYPACVSNVEALLIDEFQDTNIIQFELMKLLAAKHKRITIVGDPDQSIYGFRSAEIKNLRQMKTTYPQTVVINLEENYRSASAILKLAQKLIEQDAARPAKKLKATRCYGTKPVLRRLPNPNEEALWIANEIKRIHMMTGPLLRHSDFAILLRSAYLSLLIEKALASQGIPYRMVGGQRFFDRAEIRILIDYLRTISHPDNNQSFLAIINNPSRKIGETIIAEMVRLAEERKISVWTVAQKVLVGDLAFDKRFPTAAEQALGRLVAMIKNARQKVSTTLPANVPSMLIDLVVKSIGFEDYLRSKYKEDHEERLENVKELIAHASEVLVGSAVDGSLPIIDGVEQQPLNGGQEVLAQFLSNIVLSSEVEKGGPTDEISRVTISTIHSAKGLEWPVVFIPAMYEGSIPHSRAEDTDEERRLLYVAMTRAQGLLTMTFPLVQSREETPSKLSSFLPLELHRLVASTGPLFGDKVIENLATILRRPAPSQEDLIKSLETMSAGGSQVDNLWPIDGSRRPFIMPFFESKIESDFAKPLGEALAGGSKALHSRYYGNGKNEIPRSLSNTGVSTTMRDVSAFSTSNMTMGFTTASYQMKTAPVPDLKRSSSDHLSPQKKPKLSKSASGNGNIATFFSRPATQPSLPELTASFTMPTEISPPKAKPEPVRHVMNQPIQTASMNGIPSELSSHRLQYGSGMISNRPLSSKSTGFTSTGRYRAIYSSPSPEPPVLSKANNAQRPQPKENNENNTRQSNEKFAASKEQPTNSGTVPFKNHLLSRPVNTMHSTTMSSLGQSGGYNISSGYGKKTLGVRRQMNGWDARKNK